MSGQRFVSVSEHPTCMVRGTPKTLRQNLNTDNLNRVSPPTFTRQKWGEAPPSHILSPIWADPLLLPIFSWRAIGCCIFSSFWKTSSRGMVIYQLIRPETGALRGCLRSRRSLSRPRKAWTSLTVSGPPIRRKLGVWWDAPLPPFMARTASIRARRRRSPGTGFRASEIASVRARGMGRGTSEAGRWNKLVGLSERAVGRGPVGAPRRDYVTATGASWRPCPWSTSPSTKPSSSHDGRSIRRVCGCDAGGPRPRRSCHRGGGPYAGAMALSSSHPPVAARPLRSCPRSAFSTTPSSGWSAPWRPSLCPPFARHPRTSGRRRQCQREQWWRRGWWSSAAGWLARGWQRQWREPTLLSSRKRRRRKCGRRDGDLTTAYGGSDDGCPEHR